MSIIVPPIPRQDGSIEEPRMFTSITGQPVIVPSHSGLANGDRVQVRMAQARNVVNIATSGGFAGSLNEYGKTLSL